MKNAICVSGNISVDDILNTLELDEVPERWDRRRDERLIFDDCEVLAEDAYQGLDEADKLPAPEGMSDIVDERVVIDLAEAIRCGDRAEAELLLDRLFAGGDDALTIREWIDRGRFSKRAREAVRNPALAKAA
jgi:hypothetical protein